MIADCLQGVGKCILTASGLQKYGAFFTLIAYFVFGIPISWYLSFKADWGINGLWYGPTVACAFNFFVYYFIFEKTDWQKLIDVSRILR